MRDQDRQRPTTEYPSDVTADDLFRRIVEIINDARGRVTRVVNSAMVQTYWEIGRQIVEVEQQGDERAGYGEQVLVHLSDRLTQCFGRGFSLPHLKRMRQFFKVYAAYPIQLPAFVDNDIQQIGSALRSELLPTAQPQFRQELGWTHDRLLMTIANPTARSFYETEAAREGWSCRELERQIASHLYERLAASRDKDDILALAHQGQDVSTPQDVVKDPLVLEFLGLSDRPHWRERDLEQAIIDHLQEFMLELGKLTHRDLGQLQMYVNWYDRTQREAHEEPTVGIALCSRRNDAMVRMTLPEGEKRIVAARYEMLLPSAKELEAAVQEGRRAAERQGPSGCGPAS
jgi:predicted nuclease of restriction endonuclease-like (RecB) superfamily